MGDNITYLSNGGCRISDVILDRLGYGFDLLKRGVPSTEMARENAAEPPAPAPVPRRKVNVYGLLTEGSDLLVAAVRALHGMRADLSESDLDLIRDAIVDVRGALGDAELMGYDFPATVSHSARSNLEDAQRLLRRIEEGTAGQSPVAGTFGQVG